MIKGLFSSLLFLIFSGAIAQENPPHKPWKLDGADQRINEIRKGDAVLSFVHEGGVDQIGKLKIELVNHDFNFGVSLTQESAFQGTKYLEMYRERVAELFNFVTLGFYWVARDETKNLTNFNKRMDEKISWAVKNNLKIKGHPLLWHESLPKWVIENRDPEQLEKKIYERIESLILSYPEIQYWDVYNEAVAPFKNHVTPNGVSRWIGFKGGIYPAMLDLYELVNKIDSTKIYTNNHYHPKDPKFFNLNTYFIEKEVGFQAIGMQAHMQTKDNIIGEDELWDLLNLFAPLGKDIQFTEITVTSSKLFENWKDHQVFLNRRKEAQKRGKQLVLPSLDEREIFQSAYLKDFYTLAFSHPSVSSITMWNLSDRNAWRGHAGGILNEEMIPKRAFFTLKKLIKETWTTKLEAEISLHDSFNFSGFYGQYRGSVEIDGKSYKISFDHKKSNQNPIQIVLKDPK